MFLVCSGQDVPKVLQGRTTSKPVTGGQGRPRLTDLCEERRLARLDSFHRRKDTGRVDDTQILDCSVALFYVEGFFFCILHQKDVLISPEVN